MSDWCDTHVVNRSLCGCDPFAAPVESGAMADAAVAARLRQDGRLHSRTGLSGLPPMEPLIYGVLDKRTVNIVAGWRASFKSFLVLDFALCLATGKPWLDRQAQRAKHVLYVVGEGAYGLDKRVSAWEVAWRRDTSTAPITFMEARDLWRGGRPYLYDVEAVCRSLGADVLIFDTLSTVFPGADDNSSADMPALVGALTDTRGEIDGTVILVHHTGKDQSRGARGHSSLEGNVDQVLAVSAEERLVTLKPSKVKDEDGSWQMMLRAKVVTIGGIDSMGRDRTSIVLESADRDRDRGAAWEPRIVQALEEANGEWMTTAQIVGVVEAMPQQRAALMGALSVLGERGTLERSQTGMGSRWRLPQGTNDTSGIQTGTERP